MIRKIYSTVAAVFTMVTVLVAMFAPDTAEDKAIIVVVFGIASITSALLAIAWRNE